MAKKNKYRVIAPFAYRGKDGLSKAPVKVSPGEPVPPLDSNQVERFMMEGSICETDMYGENIVTKKLMRMNPQEIERLLQQKGPKTIMQIIQSTPFDKETLALMLAWSEKMRMPPLLPTKSLLLRQSGENCASGMGRAASSCDASSRELPGQALA